MWNYYLNSSLSTSEDLGLFIFQVPSLLPPNKVVHVSLKWFHAKLDFVSDVITLL